MVTLVSLYKGLIVENLGIHRIEAFLHEHSIQTEVIYLSTMRLHRQFNISCFEDSEIIGISAYVHTAVSSGSWCGGQRQQCGDSGSGLR